MTQNRTGRYFDGAMATITVAALVAIVGSFLGALWDALTWGTFGKVAITAAIAWVALVILVALIFRPRKRSQ